MKNNIQLINNYSNVKINKDTKIEEKCKKCKKCVNNLLV